MATGPISFVGGVGGVGPQRIGSGKSIPSEVTRYFRRNLGTIDYALFASDISLTTSFVVEFDLLISPATPDESKIMDGGTGGGTDRLDVNWQRVNQAIDARGYFDVFVNGVENGVVADNNTFNAISLVRAAGNADQLTKIISTLYARVGNTGSNASIIVANLKISSAGTPIHSLAIDDDSSTLVDSIGGNNATVINGLASDWVLFTEQDTGDWLGQELVVNGGFDTDSDWVKGTGWSIAGGAAIGVSIDSFDKTLVQPNVMSVGILYSISLDGTVDTGELVIANASQSPINGETGITPSVTSFETTWLSDSADVFIKRNININNATVTKVSVKEVLNVA